MAAALGVFSMRMFQSRRLESTVEAFFPNEEKKPKGSSQIEQDYLQLSPFNQVRQLVESFRTSAATGAEMTVDLTVPENSGKSDDGADSLIDRDLDLMLRMLAEDDDDYQRLRGRVEDLLKLAQHGKGHPARTSAARPTSAAKPAKASEPAKASGPSAPAEPTKGGPVPQEDRSLSGPDRAQGRFQNIQVSVKKQTEQVDIMAVRIKEADPLVLDLDGNGIDLTKAGEGAIFDINADGRLEQTAWVRGNDALLVLDRNGNGTIDDGKELFGEQHGATDGLQELARFDRNRDGKITIADPVFKALQLYRDLNGNGKVDAGELSSLQQHGIKALNLHFMRDNAKINGNSILLKTTFEREDGTSGVMADVLLGFRDDRA